MRRDDDMRDTTEAPAQAGFAAYAITRGADDPLAQALHRLIDHVAEQDRQIERMQRCLQQMGAADLDECCAPLDAGALNRMVD